ncbi:MAG: hypothetical protein HUU23_10135 [Caldilineales bacterium]|nr:hypothetical protein [Caldilineales bacterium]
MNIALQIQEIAYSLDEVSATVNFALRQEAEQARLRRQHYLLRCRAFEESYGFDSVEFMHRFENGELGDDSGYFDWYAAKRAFDLWDRRFLILSGVSV